MIEEEEDDEEDVAVTRNRRVRPVFVEESDEEAEDKRGEQ